MNRNTIGLIIIIVTGIIAFLIYQTEPHYYKIGTGYDKKGNKISEVFQSNKGTSKINKWVKYYLKGNKKEVFETENGIINGWRYSYYENGTLESKAFWLNGKQYGDADYFTKTGIMELYNAIDFLDRSFYIMQFDSLGKKIKEEGIVLSPTIVLYDRLKNIYSVWNPDTTLENNKNIELFITVANPPNTRAIVSVKSSNDKDLSITSGILSISNNSAIIKIHPIHSGRYTLLFRGDLINSQTNTFLKVDSITTKILIK